MLTFKFIVYTNLFQYNDSGMIPDHPMYAKHIKGAQDTILHSHASSATNKSDSSVVPCLPFVGGGRSSLSSTAGSEMSNIEEGRNGSSMKHD